MRYKTNDRRLKILFVTPWYPSDSNPVMGTFVREHARAASLYNDITVVASCRSGKKMPRRHELSETEEDGIKTMRFTIHEEKPSRTGYLLELWGLWTSMRGLFRAGYLPDIIHAHTFFAGMPAVIFGKRLGVPVVITEHYSGFPLKLLNLPNRLMARFAMGRADMVLPVSHNLREHIASYGIKGKFKVVPNTVNTKLFHPGESPGPGKRILLVSRLTGDKGIEHLGKALCDVRKQREDFSLDVVGEGPGRAGLETLAEECGLKGAVRFYPHATRHHLAAMMRECDFLVHPSLYETFGVVLIEALATGKPVIATASGGPEEIVSSKTGLLVPPGDSRALAGAIAQMLENHAEYDPETLAAIAKERYGYETVGRMLDEVYRETLMG